jgi:hypothetical protein
MAITTGCGGDAEWEPSRASEVAGAMHLVRFCALIEVVYHGGKFRTIAVRRREDSRMLPE